MLQQDCWDTPMVSGDLSDLSSMTAGLGQVSACVQRFRVRGRLFRARSRWCTSVHLDIHERFGIYEHVGMHVHAALACAHTHGTVSALRIAEHILQAFFDNMGMDADTLEVPEPSQWTHDSLLGSRSRLAVMDPMAYPMADGALSALDACDPWYHCMSLLRCWWICRAPQRLCV
ncbi:MAG: hypothetical protein ACPIOQ_11025 [Promethearchaeia archaeon]